MREVGEEMHLETEEARGASTPHIVRYVLMFSLLLAILALSAVWIIGAVREMPAKGWPVTAEQHALGG